MLIFKVLAFFVIYSFLGWVVEVAFHAITMGKFVNRGMLQGPYCPIYGIGVIGIVYLLNPYTSNFWLTFLGSAILCSLIELVGGFVLDKLFHQRWWDYSDVAFNIGGYICLKFSIYWGIGGTILMEQVHPTIDRIVNITPKSILIAFSVVCSLAILIDMISTVSNILKWNRVVERLSKQEKELRRISDKIGYAVASETLEIEKNVNEKKVAIREFKETAKKDREEFISEKRAELEKNIERINGQKEELAEKIGEKRENFAERVEERRDAFNEKVEERRGAFNEKSELGKEFEAKLEEFKNRFNDEYSRLPKGSLRRIKAFPKLKNTKHEDKDFIVQMIKEKSENKDRDPEFFRKRNSYFKEDEKKNS